MNTISSSNVVYSTFPPPPFRFDVRSESSEYGKIQKILKKNTLCARLIPVTAVFNPRAESLSSRRWWRWSPRQRRIRPSAADNNFGNELYNACVYLVKRLWCSAVIEMRDYRRRTCTRGRIPWNAYLLILQWVGRYTLVKRNSRRTLDARFVRSDAVIIPVVCLYTASK